MNIIQSATALVFLLGATPVTGEHTPSREPALAKLVPDHPPHAPGCAIGVSMRGVEQYAAWGLADIEHAVPMATDTVFHAASLAKQFTAYAIGRLAADGRLDLDHDVRRYLPELPNYGRPITVRHLVHHTSGLRDQGGLLFLGGWRPDDRVTRRDALDAIYRQRGLNFLPGQQDLYNNSGYTLLAEIVARVTGQTLADYAGSVIFRPLGLSHTRFYDDPAVPEPKRARAYRRDGETWRLAEPRMEVYGASNLLTTVGDLLTWQRHLLSPSADARPIVEWMRTAGMLADGTPTGYGGGLYVGEHRGQPSFGHDGLDGGYSARSLALPKESLALAVLCNGTDSEPGRLADTILDAWLPSSSPPSQKNDVLIHDLAIAGLYWSPDNDAVMELYSDAEGYLSRRNPPGWFVQSTDGTYRIGAERWRYEPAADGRPPRLLALYDPLPPRTFELIVDPDPANVDLNALVGAYRSEEQAATYQVTIHEGQLAIRWHRTPPVILKPAGRDRFFSPLLGTVTFQRGHGDLVTGLALSLRRAWRVPARRLETPSSVAP